MKVFIITGASRGLGLGVADILIEQGEAVQLICIARNEKLELTKKAEKKGVPLNFLKADLADLGELDTLMDEAFNLINKDEVKGVYLINNAGTVEPIAPLEKCRYEDIKRNIDLNLSAPLILSSAFVRHTRIMKAEKRVITVTSGASKRAIYGWSAYCSAKAGVNLFTACAAEEEKDHDHGVGFAAFSPGVMDTDMQVTIRSSSKENFKPVDDFRGLKEDGKLRPAHVVADKLLQVLFSAEFPNGEFVDIKDLVEE